MDLTWYDYDSLESGWPYDWSPATKHDHPDDQIDFHIDLGAGRVPKGRISIDRNANADVLMDLNTLHIIECPGPRTIQHPHYPEGMFCDWRVTKALPFPENSIKSIISHHCLEHIGDGFIRLMDECYRVLEPGGKFRIIVPLFPSFNAVCDPDHSRYFCVNSFDSFCHEAGPEIPHWHESFADPYTKARFKLTAKDYTAAPTLAELGEPVNVTLDDLFDVAREMRITLQK
jgi:SAM-dependent methyltransferase